MGLGDEAIWPDSRGYTSDRMFGIYAAFYGDRGAFSGRDPKLVRALLGLLTTFQRDERSAVDAPTHASRAVAD